MTKRYFLFSWKLVLAAFLLSLSLLAISTLLGKTGGVAFAARPQPTPTPAPTPPPGVPWLLESYAQTTCDVQGNPATEMITYYGIWINGTWKKPITVSVTNTPSGTQSWSTYQNPIPAGSSDGIGSLTYMAVQVPSNTSLGTYTLQLVATDGTLTQSVPITLDVQTQCAVY